MTHPLNMLADVLEKSADYVDALEKRASELEAIAGKALQEETEKKAATLKTRLRHVVGGDFADEDVQKLAASKDPAVELLLRKLASVDEADELGSSVRVREKVASNTTDEDQQFMSWLLG